MKGMKGLALALALLLVFSTFSAIAFAEGKEHVTIKWYFPMGAQPDQDVVFAKANEIIEAALNTTVEFIPISFGDYNQKMQVIITSGEQFDMCMTSNTRADYYQNIARNAYIQIDDLLKNNAPELLNFIPEKIWNGTKVGGHYYGIPNYQISAMVNGVWVVKSLADKYGFDIASVKKLPDLEPFFDQILASEAGVTPNVYQTSMSIWGYSIQSNGMYEVSSRNVPGAIYIDDADLNVVNQFATPEFAEHLNMVRRWYEKGYLRADAASIADATAELNMGLYASGYHGSEKPGAAAETSAKYGYEVVSTRISEPIMLTSSIVATMTAISRTSAHPDRVMEFINFLFDTENTELYNLLCYGIEGTHYTLENGKVAPVADSTYKPGVNWVLGSTFNAYPLASQSDTVWEETIALNNSAKESYALGFSFSPANVEAEIAQCKSVVDEYFASMDSGSVDPAVYLPEFLAKLEASGVNKIITEMQSQIDAWKAAK